MSLSIAGVQCTGPAVWYFHTNPPVTAARQYRFSSYDPITRRLPDQFGDEWISPSVLNVQRAFPVIASTAWTTPSMSPI